jgi:hypothetical protein
MARQVYGIGTLLLTYGIVSIIMYFLDYNLRIMLWIDSWGDLVGYALRGAFIVIGGILMYIGSRPLEVTLPIKHR